MSAVAVVATGRGADDRIAALRAAGHEVTAVELDPSSERVRSDGLPAIAAPPLDVRVSPVQLAQSYRLYRCLEGIRFDVILFDDLGADGYCAARARQTGLAFPSTRLAVHCRGPVQWRAEAERRPFLTIDDVREAACQRLQVELADVVVGAPALLEWIRQEGWELRGEQHPDTEHGWSVALPLSPVSAAAADPAEAPPSPAVTVVVPHHERPSLLSYCLEGLAEQTYSALEVVVVDDGSTLPGSQRGLDGIERRSWPWPLSVLREPHGGVHNARNAGWRAARTELVVFLDDDDIPVRTMVETLVRARATADVDVVVAGTRTFRGEGAAKPGVDDVVGINLGQPYEFGLLGNQYGGAVCLWQRALLDRLGGFRYGGVAQEDGELLVRATLAGATITVVPEPLYWHRRRPGAEERSAAMREGWAAFASWSHAEAMPDGYKLLPLLAAGAYWELDRRERELDAEIAGRSSNVLARARRIHAEHGTAGLLRRGTERLRRRR